MMMTYALLFIASSASVSTTLFRWRDPPISDEEAFASLKAGMDNLPPDSKMFLNSGAYVKGYISFLCLTAPSIASR
jgi:hypothetical protein